ncbi:MAG: type II toxin-antitoxin system HicA family toxin [Candidatus Micrarchaeia archaeon]
MPKLPLLKAKQLAKILEKLGFQFLRQQGSHMFFQHPDGRTTVVPNHPGEQIDRGLLNKIIRKDIQITREEFDKLL